METPFAVTPGGREHPSCDIRDLTVALLGVVASGEWRRLGRRRLTHIRDVPEG